jgi:hypothetical protein
MKKVLLAVATALVVVGMAQADFIPREWAGKGAGLTFVGSGNEPMPKLGDDFGSGWAVDIAVAGSDPQVASLVPDAGSNSGWYDGYGYYILPFPFIADENENVVMRLFNNADQSAALKYMDSDAFLLPDLNDDEPPSAAALAVNFTWAASEWKVIPEPATIGLMGVAGLGMFLARRKWGRVIGKNGNNARDSRQQQIR